MNSLLHLPLSCACSRPLKTCIYVHGQEKPAPHFYLFYFEQMDSAKTAPYFTWRNADGWEGQLRVRKALLCGLRSLKRFPIEFFKRS